MIPVVTYKEIKNYINAFVEGNINLLLIEGTGGIGKTATVTKTLESTNKKYKYISGHLTALEFYLILFHNRNDCIFVLDDIDALLKNPIHTSLLKQLCDTKPVKKMQYHTTSSRMQDVPSEFIINAPVIILANHINNMNDDIQALFTRGVHIEFKPTVLEVVTHARTYLNLHAEVILFVENHLPILTYIDLRKMVLANDMYYSKHIDWKDWFRSELGIKPEYEIVINLSKEFTTFKERSRAFRERTGKSEATYVRYQKVLKLTHL